MAGFTSGHEEILSWPILRRISEGRISPESSIRGKCHEHSWADRVRRVLLVGKLLEQGSFSDEGMDLGNEFRGAHLGDSKKCSGAGKQSMLITFAGQDCRLERAVNIPPQKFESCLRFVFDSQAGHAV